MCDGHSRCIPLSLLLRQVPVRPALLYDHVFLVLHAGRVDDSAILQQPLHVLDGEIGRQVVRHLDKVVRQLPSLVHHEHRQGDGVEVRVRLEAVKAEELAPVHSPRQLLQQFINLLAVVHVGFVHMHHDVNPGVSVVHLVRKLERVHFCDFSKGGKRRRVPQLIQPLVPVTPHELLVFVDLVLLLVAVVELVAPHHGGLLGVHGGRGDGGLARQQRCASGDVVQQGLLVLALDLVLELLLLLRLLVILQNSLDASVLGSPLVGSQVVEHLHLQRLRYLLLLPFLYFLHIRGLVGLVVRVGIVQRAFLITVLVPPRIFPRNILLQYLIL
mmetsp:Transcript_15802/g.29547  ORF Transcript_15802/g.29547 Transcript_15802/m.29547 type:complete len:328 (+) Transcript_15802:117-1100(+)